jgi:tetratricopeptide (TPR) repeat protein
MFGRIFFACLLIAGLGASSRVAAQATASTPSAPSSPGDAATPPTPSSTTTAEDEEARALYAAGQRAFEAGSFERALEHFRRAYDLSHRVGLLYNIGVANDRLRRDTEALEAFEAYLAQTPESDPQRSQVAARVTALREAVARQQVAEPIQPPTPPMPTTPAGPDLTGPIVLVAGGGAIAIAGAVLLGLAASEDGMVQSAMMGTRWEDVRSHHESAETFAIAGGVAVGVGVAVAVGGAVWIATSGSNESVSVAVGPGGVRLSGSF